MYRNLRAEMARYDMTVKDLADICGISLVTMSNKLNGHVDFTLSEVRAIVTYFSGKGDDVTAEYLFFDNVSAKAD